MGQGDRDHGRKHRTVPHPVAARVGRRIRELREQQQVSFDELVGVSELGRGYISEVERGLVVPTVAKLDRIASALGVSMADLVIEQTPRDRLYRVAARLSAKQIEHLIDTIDKMLAPEADPDGPSV